MSKRSKRAMFDRRQIIAAAPAAIVGSGAALLAGSGARAQQVFGKDRVQYQPSPNSGKTCSQCVHFMNGSCERVEGEIAASGWCLLWNSYPEPEEAPKDQT